MGRANNSSGPVGRTSYDRLKTFEGKRYTGMAVGRSHHWQYDPGDWTEKKVTPDRWTIHFAVKKHRKGRAPEGSGAPVGTSHHWYILADQVVTKLDANTYSTELRGTKFKLAHKRAGSDTWSGGDVARRRQLVRILQQMIAELESPPAAAPAPSGAPAQSARPRRASRPPRRRSQRGGGRGEPPSAMKRHEPSAVRAHRVRYLP